VGIGIAGQQQQDYGADDEPPEYGPSLHSFSIASRPERLAMTRSISVISLEISTNSFVFSYVGGTL
jgi:hypothetical protein